MKKLVLLIVVSLFYVSNLTAQENNPYDYVGKEHNKILDFTYKKLTKEKKYQNFKNKANINFLKNCVIEYYKLNKKEKSSQISDIRGYLDKYPFPISSTGPYYPKSMKKKYRLSNKFDEMLSRIFNSVDTANTKSLIQLVETIKKDKQLNVTEKKFLYATISIGYNSLNYWKKNVVKWKNIGKGGGNNKFSLPSWAKSDIRGAVIGGLGTGTLAGAIVVGAIWSLTD